MALLIFDLDGTLLDSIEGLATAMNKVLKKHDYPTHDPEAYKHFVGNGIRMLVERAMPEGKQEEADALFQEMMAIYKVDYKIGLKPYDGIDRMLDGVLEQGHTIAMITNKFQFMADVIMPEYFGDYPFTHSIGRGERFPAKPSPESILYVLEQTGISKEEAYMIGDTEVDLMAARQAGIQEVYVSWGFRKPSEVADYGPKVTIDKPEGLLEVVAGSLNGRGE